MSFVPYQVLTDRLPILRKRHVIKIGGNFFEVVQVFRDRKKIPENLVEAATILDVAHAPAYENLYGSLDLKRVVHIRYLGLTTAIDCIFFWLTEPLLSGTVQDILDNDLAGLGGIGAAGVSNATPFEVNKWSYDQSMHFTLTKIVGAQMLYWDLIEYRVEKWKGTGDPKVYLEIDEKGEASFHGF